MVGFRIQQRVQRLFDRRPNHFIQMRLNASFIDLYYRTQVPLDPVFRPSSRFHGWLHRARLRGLAPPACTNLHDSNSNQMCERYPTLSMEAARRMLEHELVLESIRCQEKDI